MIKLVHLKVAVLAWLVVSLTGCGLLAPIKTESKVGDDSQVYLTKTAQWKLPPPSVIPGTLNAVQQVQAHYGDQTYDLLFQLEKPSNDRLVIAGLTLSGQSLFQGDYHDGVLTSTVSPLVGRDINLSYIVSSLILAYGKPDVLSRYLDDAGLSLTVTPFEDGHSTRLIKQNNAVVTSIKLIDPDANGWPRKVIYRNTALDFELDISTLQGGFQ